MKRLFLSTNETPERWAIDQAATNAGWWTYPVGYKDHVASNRDHGGTDVVYGGTLWAEVVASRLGLNLLETPQDWLVDAPVGLTGRSIRLTTRKELQARYESGRAGWPMFYKPLDKEGFVSGVYTAHSQGHYTAPLLPVADPSAVLLEQNILTLGMEVRAFVLDGEILTASLYAHQGKPFYAPMPEGFDLEVLDSLAEEVNEIGTSCPATVIDFAFDLGDRRWIVLEQNPAWSSALYCCDPALAFEVIEASCTYNESPFARERVEVVM